MKSIRFEYGCLMGRLVIKNWNKLFSNFIDEKDIYGTEEDGFGVEKSPHVTILFGFHDNNPEITDKLKKELPCEKIIDIELIGVSFFETPEYDVVKFDIKSDKLAELNEWCQENFEFTSQHKVYHAHATVAYVKKGTGVKYKRELKEPIPLQIKELIYSHPDKKNNKETWNIS